MAGNNLIEQLKKAAEDFEKTARPKIEKKIDEYGKKVDHLSSRAAKEAETAIRQAAQRGQVVAGKARKEWNALMNTALAPMRSLPGAEKDKSKNHANNNHNISDKSSTRPSRPQIKLVPEEERYDAASAAQDILDMFKAKKTQAAIEKIAFLGQEISAGRADPNVVDMSLVVERTIEHYKKGDIDAAHHLAGWTIELADNGADMAKVDPAPIRALAKDKLGKQDFGTAQAILLWSRYVESAVARNQGRSPGNAPRSGNWRGPSAL